MVWRSQENWDVMEAKINYDMIVSYSVVALKDEVNAHIGDGWEPIGGPFVWQGLLIQSMIKREGDK